MTGLATPDTGASTTEKAEVTVTTEITEPATQAEAPKPPQTSELVPAAEALVELACMFGRLPRPYVMFHTSYVRIDLQLDSPAGFEAWRTALQIAPGDVQLKEFQGNTWLAADGVYRGVPVWLTGHGLSLSAEAVEAPQAVSA